MNQRPAGSDDSCCQRLGTVRTGTDPYRIRRQQPVAYGDPPSIPFDDGFPYPLHLRQVLDAMKRAVSAPVLDDRLGLGGPTIVNPCCSAHGARLMSIGSAACAPAIHTTSTSAPQHDTQGTTCIL